MRWAVAAFAILLTSQLPVHGQPANGTPRAVPPDAVLVAADKDTHLLSSAAAGPLTHDTWAVRQSAVNRWMAFKQIPETAGAKWPEPRVIEWPTTKFKPAGLGDEAMKEVFWLLNGGLYDKSWAALWPEMAPDEWAAWKGVLIGPTPDPDAISKAMLDDWEGRFVEAQDKCVPPRTAIVYSPKRKTDEVRPAGIDGATRFTVPTFGTEQRGKDAPLLTMPGVAAGVVVDWDAAVLACGRAVRGQRGTVPGAAPTAPPVPAPWASPTKDALAALGSMVAHFDGVFGPAATPFKRTPDEIDLIRRFSDHVQQLRAPVEELHAVLVFRDEFDGRKKAAADAGAAALLNVRKGVAALVATRKGDPAATATRKQIKTDWEGYRTAAWDLSVIRRQSGDAADRFKAAAAAWHKSMTDCRQAFQDEVREAVGVRLGYEVAKWDAARAVRTVDVQADLTSPAAATARAAAAKTVADAFGECHLTPGPAIRVVPNALKMPALDDGRIGPAVLDPMAVNQFIMKLLPPAPPAGPLLVDIRGHRISFQGKFTVTKVGVGGTARPTTILVTANEVDLGGSEWLVEAGCKVCVVAHRMALPSPAGAAAVPPLVVVAGDGRFDAFASAPGASPALAHLAGPAGQIVFGTTPPDGTTWDALFQGRPKKVEEEIADFIWRVRDNHLNRFVTQRPNEPEKQRVALEDVLAVPYVAVTNTDPLIQQNARIEALAKQLFDDRVVVLTDPAAGASYPCLSRFVANKQEISLLPDALEIVPPLMLGEKLGTVALTGGRSTFAFTVRPVVSRLATVRGRAIAAARFPNAQHDKETPWRDYSLVWPAAPNLAGLPLKPPARAAWDVNRSDSLFQIDSGDGDGLGRFAAALTAGRRPETAHRVRVVLNHVGAGAVGEYDLPLDFESLGPPVNQKSPVTVRMSNGEFVAENGYATLPVRPTRRFSADAIEWLPAGLLVPPGGTGKYAVAGMTVLETRLDLTGKHPFQVFDVGGGPPPNVTAKFRGLWDARLPGADGTPGTGAYIELVKSRYRVEYTDAKAAPPQMFPGTGMSFERLAQNYPDRTYVYPVFGNYRAELVVDLFPLGGDDVKPFVIRLPGQDLDWTNSKVVAAALAEVQKKAAKP